MKIFVTSNQQFGRPGAIRSYKRPFENVEEMDAYLIKQWNSVVKEGDAVFVLGNFAWEPEKTEDLMNVLKGNIYVLEGEWDRATADISKMKGDKSYKKLSHVSDGIKTLASIKSVFSYWPLTEWPRKKKKYVSFVGHPSKKYKSDHNKRTVNVTCDYWDFKPIEAQNLVKLYEDPDLIGMVK